MPGADSISPALLALFRFIVRRRILFLALYAIVVPLAAVEAARIARASAIDRLVVQSDADFRPNQEFQRLFPERPQIILLLHAADPAAPDVLRRAAEIE